MSSSSSPLHQLESHLSKLSQTPMDRYMIHCQVVEAQNLRAADVSGYSDPYVKIKITDAKEAKNKTFDANANLNPIYNVEMSFTMPSSKENVSKVGAAPHHYIPHVRQSGSILVETLDRDKANRNDSLGFCGMRLQTLRQTGYFSGWFFLYKEKSVVVDNDSKSLSQKIRTGRVYLRFIVDYDHSKWQKQEDGEFEQYRRSLFDLVRRAELECMQTKQSPFSKMKFLTPASLSNSYFISNATALASCNNLPETEHSVISESVDVRILCATWNTGNCDDILPYELRFWLRPGNDIYVVSTQENSYDVRKAQSKFKTHAEDWQHRLSEALGVDYMMLQSQSLGQIHIHVFVRRTLRPLVDLIQLAKASEATGIASVGTNKGGVCVAMNILGESYCFISSHLAAHTEMLDRRNKDAGDILAGLKYKGNYDLNTIASFNHIFFMGDLNYRLNFAGDKNTPDPEKHALMLEMIKQGKYSELMETDQLVAEMQKGNVFVKFSDCTPNFPPTFKLEPGQAGVYNPKRAPSYCDRILWYSHPTFAQALTLVSVKSVPTLTKSDHTPVMALFNSKAPMCPPSTDPTKGDVRIVFHGASCSDLPAHDVSGFSDPYLKFVSPYLLDMNNCTFPKKNKTLNPVWEAVELREFSWIANNLDRLQHCTLPFKIYDRDLASTSIMGTGVIPFNALDLTDSGVISEITVDIRNEQGLPAGTATFKIQIAWKKLNASTALTPYEDYTSGKRKVGL